MTCSWCEKTIPILRALTGAKYCSTEHRREEFKEEQTFCNLSLARQATQQPRPIPANTRKAMTRAAVVCPEPVRAAQPEGMCAELRNSGGARAGLSYPQKVRLPTPSNRPRWQPRRL